MEFRQDRAAPFAEIERGDLLKDTALTSECRAKESLFSKTLTYEQVFPTNTARLSKAPALHRTQPGTNQEQEKSLPRRSEKGEADEEEGGNWGRSGAGPTFLRNCSRGLK